MITAVPETGDAPAAVPAARRLAGRAHAAGQSLRRPLGTICDAPPAPVPGPSGPGRAPLALEPRRCVPIYVTAFLNSPEKTPDPRRDSKKTGYTWYRGVFFESLLGFGVSSGELLDCVNVCDWVSTYVNMRVRIGVRICALRYTITYHSLATI